MPLLSITSDLDDHPSDTHATRQIGASERFPFWILDFEQGGICQIGGVAESVGVLS